MAKEFKSFFKTVDTANEGTKCKYPTRLHAIYSEGGRVLAPSSR